MINIKLLMRQFEREKNARKEAEYIAESKSLELYQSNLMVRDLLKCNITQQEVARILAESTELKKASIKILHKISEQMSFIFGAIWEINHEKNVLCCSYTYPKESAELDNFITLTKNMQLPIGIGLPGRVWENKACSWISDVTIDGNFPRFQEAQKINLHSACAFPIFFEREVVGVMEFFMHSVYPYGENLMAMLNDVSRQMSTFIGRKQILEKMEGARFTGMAEVTSSILHNVGNVINSVNTSVNFLLDKRGNPSLIGQLIKTTQLINSHRENLGEFFTENEKGKIVPEYLTSLASVLEQEHASATKELESLAKNIKHIIDIISTQFILSKSIPLLEPLLISEKIDEAITIVGFNGLITIERFYNVNKLLLVDKIKLMQILVNLIRNAKEALLAANIPEKKITITIDKFQSSLRIQVKDNGIGIDAESEKRLFTFGFTTKKEGHGFGLHSSALLAKQMGGTLSVSNRVDKKGALFTLELPYKIA